MNDSISKRMRHAVNKACMIQAPFTWLGEDTVPQLYKALARPHLEYGNII